jgi:hypothetical protein
MELNLFRNEIEIVFIQHNKNYPSLDIQDFVKLLYQSCFGPKHLYGNPTDETINNYLNDELKQMAVAQNRDIEDIGNGYIRIYLDAIKNHTITKQVVLTSFKKSMNSPMNEQEATDKFNIGLETLASLCETNEMPFTKCAFESFMNQYLKKGIRAIHHSPTYNALYQPHYRVVLKSIFDIENGSTTDFLNLDIVTRIDKFKQ